MMRALLLLCILLLGTPPRAPGQGLPEMTRQDSAFALFACYAQHLGLIQQGWNIEVEFEDLELDSVAATGAIPSYWQARIRIDSTKFFESGDRPRREVVIHELLHIVLWEPIELAHKKDRDEASRREEKVVTYLARRPFWYLLCTWPTQP